MEMCEACPESVMEFGRHLATAIIKEVGGRAKKYCCIDCANADEYAWVKFGMSHKDAQKYLDVNME